LFFGNKGSGVLTLLFFFFFLAEQVLVNAKLNFVEFNYQITRD
jgi:hypothetical protein